MTRPLRCIAIDDEPLALSLIQDYCQRIPQLQLLYAFEDAISAAEFLNKNKIDLLFIDIDMPDINGIDLVKSLKEKPMIVFTTAYKNFALEGFELEAIDYLLKPIEYKRFLRAAEKALDFHRYKYQPKETKVESIYIYSEYKMIKINLLDIEYIESLQDYIRIYLIGSNPILSLMTLKKILEKLPPEKFKRIHRSYVIAVERIESIHNKKIRLSTVELPISDSYSSFIKEWTK